MLRTWVLIAARWNVCNGSCIHNPSDRSIINTSNTKPVNSGSYLIETSNFWCMFVTFSTVNCLRPPRMAFCHHPSANQSFDMNLLACLLSQNSSSLLTAVVSEPREQWNNMISIEIIIMLLGWPAEGICIGPAELISSSLYARPTSTMLSLCLFISA